MRNVLLWYLKMFVEDKEADLMAMIMSPIVTCQRLLSQARLEGWSSLPGG